MREFFTLNELWVLFYFIAGPLLILWAVWSRRKG